MKKKKKTTNSKKSTKDKKNKQSEKAGIPPSFKPTETIDEATLEKYRREVKIQKLKEEALTKRLQSIKEDIQPKKTTNSKKSAQDNKIEQTKETTNSKKSIQDKLNERLKKAGIPPSLFEKCRREVELQKLQEKELFKSLPKYYLPKIFLHFIIGLLKNEYFEYPDNIGTIDEMVNEKNYRQLLQPFYTNGLAEHFVFQKTEGNTINKDKFRHEIFVYYDEELCLYKDFCKMSDVRVKILPDFERIKKSVILFLNKESETATEKFLEEYISDFEQDKLLPKGDYYPFAYQNEKMQELISNLHEIYPKTKKIKVSYDMSLLNDKQIRLPEMLLLYSMKKYISIDEVSINPKDLYFKISILNIPEKKDTSNDILEYKGLSLDVKTGRVEYNGKEIKGIFKYRNTERFYIFEMLMRNPGRLIYIDELRKAIASKRHRKQKITLDVTLKTTIDRLKRDLRMTKTNKQTQLTISLTKEYGNTLAIKLQ